MLRHRAHALSLSSLTRKWQTSSLQVWWSKGSTEPPATPGADAGATVPVEAQGMWPRHRPWDLSTEALSRDRQRGCRL